MTSLQSENERLQSELSNLERELSGTRQEREELEMSISELDEQHQAATDTLISARNNLQTELAESNKQVNFTFFLVQ